jgi:membrane protease subunit HflC
VQSILRFLVTAVIILAILGFMTMYTVRFTESAVVTTFGKADQTSVIKEPGLRFKLPYPIQSVTRYDTRSRFVAARPETRNTADDRQIIVSSFITYRVTDPLKFYQMFSNAGSRPEKHFDQADELLRARLRFALTEAGKFRFDELFNTQGGAAGESGIARLESQVFDQIRAATPDSKPLSDYGVEPLTIGISSIKLPESAAKAVMDSMAQKRLTIAQASTAAGAAEASRITTDATADANKILAFAESRARAIRGTGEKEAAKYFAMQSTDPELAVFLKNLEFMREAAAGKITLVLPQSMPGMQLFSFDALNKVPSGKLPSMLPPLPTTGAPAGEKRSEGDKAKEDGKVVGLLPEAQGENK